MLYRLTPGVQRNCCKMALRTTTDLLLFSVAALLLVPGVWLASVPEKEATSVSTEPVGAEQTDGQIFATRFREANKNEQQQKESQHYQEPSKPEKKPCEDKTGCLACPMAQVPCHIHLPQGCHLLTVMGYPFFPSMMGFHCPCAIECRKFRHENSKHNAEKDYDYRPQQDDRQKDRPRKEDGPQMSTAPDKYTGQRPSQGRTTYEDLPIGGPGGRGGVYTEGKTQENPRHTSLPIERIPPAPTALQVRSSSYNDEEDHILEYRPYSHSQLNEEGRRYANNPHYGTKKPRRPIYLDEIRGYSSAIDSEEAPHSRCRCVGVCSPTYEDDNGEAVYAIGKHSRR